MKKTILLLASMCLALFANAQVSKTIAVPTAGTLNKYLSKTERTTVTNLTLTGTINARDFKTMRDSLTVLADLDIKDVVIAPYTGTLTHMYGIQDFSANAIPENAFFNTDLLIKDSTLTSIQLPTSAVSIDPLAFFNCSSLKSIYIPKSITKIWDEVFWGCSAIITVDPLNPNYSSQDGVLFNKDKTTLIQCPSSKSGAYTIPSSVNVIGYGAFSGCTLLTSLTIPASVNSIGESAFQCCTSLIYVYSKNAYPLILKNPLCLYSPILYVPIGSKSAYQSALYWKELKNIIETDFVGIEELGNDNVIISPNPAKESISVNADGKSEVSIYSLTGSLLLQTMVNSHELISLNSLPTSVYIVKVVTDKATIVQQFIRL